MGINPAMGMGMMGGSDDFYTQMLYQQMMAQQNGVGTGAKNGAVAGGGGDSSAANQTAKKGGSLGSAAVWGIGTGAAAGAGMYFTNNLFNSPIEEVKGKRVFSEKFLNHFSGEYAAMQNGDKLKKFYTGLSNTKSPVTAENFQSTMDSIEEFMKSGDVDDLSAEAKQVLKKRFGLAKADKAALEGLHSTKLNDIRNFFTETHYGVADLEQLNNLNAKAAMLESLDGIKDGWKSLGKGADSVAGKIEFLRENAHTIGLDKADYEKLLKDGLTETEVDDIFKKFNVKTRKNALNGEINTIKKAMQKFVSKWDKNGSIIGGGFKKVGNAKTLEALNNSLKAFRKSKAVPVALGAAAIGAIISFFA